MASREWQSIPDEQGKLSYYKKVLPCSSGIDHTTKIAAFDLDNTLIKPLHPQDKFIRSLESWQWLYTRPDGTSQVVEQLAKLQVEGWLVVIFSNQKLYNKLGRRTPTARDANGHPLALHIISELERQILKVSGVNRGLAAYVAISEDGMRKPSTGMWFEFFKDHQILASNLQSAFYVGDASGPLDNDPRYHWSSTDREFATNCGITFYTPSQFFCALAFLPFIPQISFLSGVIQRESYQKLDSELKCKYSRDPGKAERLRLYQKEGWQSKYLTLQGLKDGVQGGKVIYFSHTHSSDNSQPDLHPGEFLWYLN